MLYTPLFRSSSSYTCQSSMPILKCTSHWPLSLTLCELLWPPSPCPRVTSTSMGSGCELWVFNTEVTAPPGVLSTIPPWLAHRAWNLSCDPRVGCLGRRDAFLSHDFGLQRIWLSSAVQSGGLDSLHSSSGTSYSSAWDLGLISNGPESLDPLAPQ